MRVLAGMKLLELGWHEDQVAEQLMWKPMGSAVKALLRMRRNEQKKKK